MNQMVLSRNDRTCFGSDLVLTGTTECAGCTVSELCRDSNPNSPISSTVVEDYVCEREIADLLTELEAHEQGAQLAPTPGPVADRGAPVPQGKPGGASSGMRTNADSYVFPLPSYSLLSRGETTAELLRKARALCQEPDYLAVRSEYVGINMALNSLAMSGDVTAPAPRFRPRKKPRPCFAGHDYPVSDSFLSNDTQLLDMHWHYCGGRRSAKDNLADSAFSGDTFNFEAASEFVVRRGTTRLKCKVLELAPEEEWASAALQSEATRKQWKLIEKENMRLRRELRTIARRDRYVSGNEEDWADLLLAYQIEIAIVKTAPNQDRIAEWYRQLSGKPLTRQTVGKKLKAVLKRVTPRR